MPVKEAQRIVLHRQTEAMRDIVESPLEAVDAARLAIHAAIFSIAASMPSSGNNLSCRHCCTIKARGAVKATTSGRSSER